ncbi:MAG: tyrosine-type recombinase/integrase [Caldilineaceae bacterium]|nr:tyrosine-type recombinase/integrase [Caldilineaceae bacterium]
MPDDSTVQSRDPAPDLADNAAPEQTDLAPPLRADSTLGAAMDAFDDYMVRKGFSDNTIKAFRNDLKIFGTFMDGGTRLHHVSTQHLEDYLTWMQGERGAPCSAKTLARRITTLKVFFGWLHGIGVLGTDPAAPVVQQPARPPLPKILRDQEVSRLVRAAQDYLWDREKPDARPYLLVSLLLQTGIKKAECARLHLSDIDWDRPQAPELSIRYREERHAHKNRTMTLNPTIVPALHQYLEQYRPQEFLFECTPRNLEYVLEEAGERAGIRGTQVGFETLRWTCAVRDYRNGMPEERLRQKLGLSKISWRETREKIYQLAGR